MFNLRTVPNASDREKYFCKTLYTDRDQIKNLKGKETNLPNDNYLFCLGAEN